MGLELVKISGLELYIWEFSAHGCFEVMTNEIAKGVSVEKRTGEERRGEEGRGEEGREGRGGEKGREGTEPEALQGQEAGTRQRDEQSG